MSLRDATKIDLILSGTDHALTLVIVDGGQIVDPTKRYDALLLKLGHYIAFITSPDFTRDYPRTALDKVSIVVHYYTKPSAKMLQITAVMPKGSEAPKIKVMFEPAQNGNLED